MEQNKRREYLIKYLIDENPNEYRGEMPKNINQQKNLLRGLMNVRMPASISDEFLSIQNEYLKEELKQKGITSIDELVEIQKDIILWQGDITALKCDAIVNAANSHMIGCFIPCHNCIDNAIHTYAGVQLRNCCAEIMKKQETLEPTGKAKITPAYNLPCKYVIHTVGPILTNKLTKELEAYLKSCYLSCLDIAVKNELNSIAFCCISTGEFHFPNDKAAEIAIDTVKEFKNITSSNIKVIFNVFKDIDYDIYRRILS